MKLYQYGNYILKAKNKDEVARRLYRLHKIKIPFTKRNKLIKKIGLYSPYLKRKNKTLKNA